MINEARQKAQNELIQQLKENEQLQQTNTEKLEKRVHVQIPEVLTPCSGFVDPSDFKKHIVFKYG